MNEKLIDSVSDIKQLIIELGGYYAGELGILCSIKFFFKKMYNYFYSDSNTNFFPLLRNLVKKIYSNFGFEKTNDECNNFIKSKLCQYFNLTEEINDMKQGKIQSLIDDTEIDLEAPQFNEEKEQISPYDEKQTVNDINEEEPAPYHFNIEQFRQDYLTLVKLYWNSKSTFRLEENFEYLLKSQNTNNMEEKIFGFYNENDINSERLLLLVKRDFGLNNSKDDATDQEIIVLKLFYISYICNELIYSICNNLNKKEIKYTSIFNFYYVVSICYNEAIRGFFEIGEEMEKNEKIALIDGDNDAPPSLIVK